MSFWCYSQEKSGKRYLYQIDYPIVIIVALSGIIAAIICQTISLNICRNPSMVFFPFFILIGGLACLIISKISLYRKRIWFSFGSGLMSKGYVKLYKVSYFLIIMGVLLVLLLLNML